MPQALASRSLMSRAFLRSSSSASRLDSMIHGRLEASTRPLRTGPATPKHAAWGCTFAVRTNLETISSKLLYSRLGKTEAEIRLKRPSSTSKTASLALVPPMSPASIISRNSSSGGRRAPSGLQHLLGPMFQLRSWESYEGARLSTHPATGLQRTSRLLPCPPAETRFDLQSCNRAAAARSQCWAAIRNNRRTRISCSLRLSSWLVLEPLQRNVRRYLLRAECAAPIDLASGSQPEYLETEQMALDGTESRYECAEPACVYRFEGRREHPPNANYRLPASWPRRSRCGNPSEHPLPYWPRTVRLSTSSELKGWMACRILACSSRTASA